MSVPRTPAVYIPHGGGLWLFVDVVFGEPDTLARLAAHLRCLRGLPSTPPRAVLVVSAHWEERLPTVTTAERPPLLFDYFGFPPAAYELTWPAPGSPWLAGRTRALLDAAGIASAEAPERGFDHGVFVPMKLAYPAAEVPTVQLSLKAGLDPASHLAIGRALAPLRDEGVFVIGSGMSYHNMRGFGRREARAASLAFDAWLAETVALPRERRDARLVEWRAAPSGLEVHPREEHLLPLMVVAGAAGDDPGSVPYADVLMGVRISSARFG